MGSVTGTISTCTCRSGPVSTPPFGAAGEGGRCLLSARKRGGPSSLLPGALRCLANASPFFFFKTRIEDQRPGEASCSPPHCARTVSLLPLLLPSLGCGSDLSLASWRMRKATTLSHPDARKGAGHIQHSATSTYVLKNSFQFNFRHRKMVPDYSRNAHSFLPSPRFAS